MTPDSAEVSTASVTWTNAEPDTLMERVLAPANLKLSLIHIYMCIRDRVQLMLGLSAEPAEDPQLLRQWAERFGPATYRNRLIELIAEVSS